MMHDAIKNFAGQFVFEPRIENGVLPKFERFAVIGMGGSHLAADLLKVWNPALDCLIHADYGLPAMSEWALKNRLIILSSYSGNTEESIDAFMRAGERGLPRAVVATGGKLLELAQEAGVPYVLMPDIGIQPRSALGFSFRSLLKVMGEEQALAETGVLAKTLDPGALAEAGKALMNKLADHVPIVYSSTRNFPIAYTWKIKFNETGKIPAFCNMVPELNHNEMNGFDVAPSTRHLSERFSVILLKDTADDSRVIRRMEILSGMYRDRGLPVTEVRLRGGDIFHKIFSSLLLADWAAYYTAKHYGVEAEQVPMVEELKRLIAQEEMG